MSRADAYATWVEEGAGWNIGIRTGRVEGARDWLFVLDVDPKSGGHESLQGLIAECGPLPDTWMTRTGSGGAHLGFAMPDGIEVRNNQRMIAPGIDIRGTGGFVVAPPSVSGIGPYEQLMSIDPAQPMDWLVEMIRYRPVEVDTTECVEGLPSWDDLEPSERARVQKYAEVIIAREARSYALAEQGTGNATLYRAACKVFEVVQSPWNTLTADHAVDLLDQARRRRLEQVHGGQDQEEFRKTVNSAMTRVVGRGRPLPERPADRLIFDHPGLPLAIEAPDAGGDEGEQEEVGPGRPLTLKEQIRAEMLDRDALERVPPLEPLIEDVLNLGTECWLIGAPGTFKSFLALDWAAHIALGRPWRGHSVLQGRVIYMAAEGAEGVPQRVQAWEMTYGQRMADVTVLPQPIQVTNTDAWSALIEICAEDRPVLIVLDTQARITVGLEENSNMSMGILIDAVRRLKVRTGACVLVLHHTGRDGAHARGASALDGAQDTEIRVDRPDKKARVIEVSVDKQKNNDDSAEPIIVELLKLEVGIHPRTGKPITSLALKPDSPFALPPVKRKPWVEGLSYNQSVIIDVLWEFVDPDGQTVPEIRALIKERGSDMSKQSFYYAFNALKATSPDPIVMHGLAGTQRWTLASKLE